MRQEGVWGGSVQEVWAVSGRVLLLAGMSNATVARAQAQLSASARGKTQQHVGPHGHPQLLALCTRTTTYFVLGDSSLLLAVRSRPRAWLFALNLNWRLLLSSCWLRCQVRLLKFTWKRLVEIIISSCRTFNVHPPRYTASNRRASTRVSSRPRVYDSPFFRTPSNLLFYSNVMLYSIAEKQNMSHFISLFRQTKKEKVTKKKKNVTSRRFFLHFNISGGHRRPNGTSSSAGWGTSCSCSSPPVGLRVHMYAYTCVPVSYTYVCI